MSAKRPSTTRRPGGDRLQINDATQSAAERRKAEAELRTLITRFAPQRLRLIATMRRSLQRRIPTANEVVYAYRDCFVISYSPSERGYEGILAVRGDADGVRLYFQRGKELPDPEKLLKGSSKARWLEVTGASTLALSSVTRLIDEAIAGSGRPFTPGTRGSVVVRPTSATKLTGASRVSGRRSQSTQPTTGRAERPLERKRTR